uniref:Uncharacterized protein n=1 Tax=Anguilla anguilla TaxID=7936 RepID=A0A0E9UXY4_ANGAN
MLLTSITAANLLSPLLTWVITGPLSSFNLFLGD